LYNALRHKLSDKTMSPENERRTMLSKFTDLKYAIILAAGIVGLVFDRLEGIDTDQLLEPEPDDLTAITGIGAASAQRLNESGVASFAQLAALSPEQAFEITQYAAGNHSQWIADAKELA
jgi:hypothetical protein